MFVISEIEDNFELAPSFGDLTNTILQKIFKKYIRKHISDFGTGIELIDDIKVLEKRLVQDFILSKVQFKMLFFRFMRDEILNGKVMSQSSRGVSVSIGFFDKIIIEPDNLPEENESTNIVGENNEKHFAWVWRYKGNRLVIKNGEEVRMKVIHFDEKTGQLHCSFKDPGLGPMSWW